MPGQIKGHPYHGAVATTSPRQFFLYLHKTGTRCSTQVSDSQTKIKEQNSFLFWYFLGHLKLFSVSYPAVVTNFRRDFNLRGAKCYLKIWKSDAYGNAWNIPFVYHTNLIFKGIVISSMTPHIAQISCILIQLKLQLNLHSRGETTVSFVPNMNIICF